MAVQTLAKDQAKREKENQKAIDEEFKKDDENAEKDAQRMMDLMEKIYKKPTPQDPGGLSPSMRKTPGGKIIEAKKGGLMKKKCGVQMKGTSPLLKNRKGKK
jgi:hypothetical protein